MVKIVPRSHLGNYFHTDGWISQQYLKLKGSTLSNNKWVMVLDAKSIFVKHIYLSKFFDIFGRIKSGYWKLSKDWHKVETNVNSLFNIKTKGDSGWVPYLFRVDLVNDLIKDIELKTNKPFDKWFQQFEVGEMTEIALYTGYVQTRYKLWKYASKFRYMERYCVGRNRIEEANELFDKHLLHKRNHIVMIHRYVWDLLDIERKEKYKKFLISKGLTSAEGLE